MRRDPKEATPIINGFASRVMRRLVAAGDYSHQRDDIVAELWVGWCVACDRYDAAFGVPFPAYLRNGLKDHINNYLRKNLEARIDEVHALSMDGSPSGPEDVDNLELVEVVAADTPLPSEEIERKSQLAYALARLTPRAQQFVSLLANHPPELLEEVRALTAKAEFARAQGVQTSIVQRVTSALVFDLMGASRDERNKIALELKMLGAQVTRSLE